MRCRRIRYDREDCYYDEPDCESLGTGSFGLENVQSPDRLRCGRSESMEAIRCAADESATTGKTATTI